MLAEQVYVETHSISDIFEELQTECGFENYAVCNIPTDCPTKADFIKNNLFTNYSDDWVSKYLQSDFLQIDPIVQFAPRTTTATEWNDVEQYQVFNKNHESVFRTARDFNINGGLFLSSRQMNGDLQIISFSSSRRKPYSPSEKKVATVYGHLMGKAVQARTILKSKPAIAPETGANISARALECLSLCAIGKSSAEIEIILNISRHTVDFHIKNAMIELNASTRTFAVVKAIQLGLILPNSGAIF